MHRVQFLHLVEKRGGLVDYSVTIKCFGGIDALNGNLKRGIYSEIEKNTLSFPNFKFNAL